MAPNLNPDARAQGDCLDTLITAAEADESIAIVGAQILLEDGATRNAGANPLHPTGISPSGGFGEAREDGPPRDVMVVSGACFLARRDAFRELGGLAHDLFLYYDDVNLCWRAQLAGRRVVYCPRATVTHGYEFSGRGGKWFLLERNRLYTVLSHYEARTLALLAPLLLATEAGILAAAAGGGWLTEKLRAYASLWRMRRELLAQRRRVQASRRRSDAELMALFDDRLDSALMPKAATSVANLFAVPYLALVRRLRAGQPRPGGGQTEVPRR